MFGLFRHLACRNGSGARAGSEFVVDTCRVPELTEIIVATRTSDCAGLDYSYRYCHVLIHVLCIVIFVTQPTSMSARRQHAP
jgi:hypothetical protein